MDRFHVKKYVVIKKASGNRASLLIRNQAATNERIGLNILYGLENVRNIVKKKEPKKSRAKKNSVTRKLTLVKKN